MRRSNQISGQVGDINLDFLRMTDFVATKYEFAKVFGDSFIKRLL